MAGSSTATAAPALSRTAIKARTLVLKQIKDDHHAFKTAWRTFRQLDLATQGDEARALVSQTVADLRFHSHFERAHLYPAVNAGSDDRRRTGAAEVEHQEIDALLDPLLGRLSNRSQPGRSAADSRDEVRDKDFTALFKLVCDQCVRHARHEEADLFPLFKTAPVDWPALANLIRQRDELIEPTIPAVLQADPDDLLNPVAAPPVDDTIEPARVLSSPDTPAQRRAAARRAPVK